ncbi:MAG: tRNA threonylcarbamoyladenosine dehydratase, partial [Oscillospiraceae bacterium]|nr:tRNA threonylcarbamoyladenosine dehydratase [Oscillospiraceae bacterium]
EEAGKEAFFDEAYDYIADAIDSVASKVSLIVTAHERNIPIISSMGTGNRLDPTQFLITDLSKTSGCPLARVMRRELRKFGITHHTVLSSTELPLKPQIPEGGAPVPGSVAWVPPCAGMMIAGYIIRSLLAKE